MPSLELLEKERDRARHNSRYRKTLRSTVNVLIVVAAVAILAATLWLPVLRIYGTSMTPNLESGDIVLSMKGSDFKTGDVVAFYYNNKILVKRVIAGLATGYISMTTATCLSMARSWTSRMCRRKL